jgi:hypothetical protein
MAYIYDLADTWNDGATTFKGIGLNVTDSASAAASLLMDLQVGGVSLFSVSKSGELKKGSVTLLSYGVVDAFTVEVPNSAFRAGGAVQKICVTNDGVLLNTLGFSASSTPSRTTTPDLLLTRDAANTLAQRRGVNAQAFNLYNTYTDASNYERGFMRFSTSRLQFGSEAAGTGSQKDVDIQGQTVTIRIAAANRWFFYASNHFGPASDGSQDIGTSTLRVRNFFQGSGYHDIAEMTAPAAPAANGVRIYAEDDGSGKTRLMALFATGAAQQIAIEP